MDIIKKVFYGEGSGMDSDSSPKLIARNAYLNLMNGRMAVTEQGRNGRIEGYQGTSLITNSYKPAGTNQTIGSAPDLDNSRVIFVNHNSNGNHGIYCYDTMTLLLYPVLLNSNVTGGLGVIRSSLIHSCRVENGYFYWVDGTNNEPRRVNINYGINLNVPGTFPSEYAYTSPISQSVLYWIRKQPGLSLSSAKGTIGSFHNNFIKNEAFQFGWRYIYRGYEQSTLSGWSTTQNFNLSADTYNYIAITANSDEVIEQDVLQVDFVVKFLVGGKSFIIKSWNKDIATDAALIAGHNTGTPLTFDFFNDVAGIALDDAYSVKPFDSCPIYAQTIEMARNRAFLANVTAGYSTPVITSLAATAIEQADSVTVSGRWVSITYNSGMNVHYFLDILGMSSGDGFYDISPQPPPFPGTVAFGDISFVASGPSNFASYVVATYSDWTGGIVYTGDTSTVTGSPPAATLSGELAFKSGAAYQLSISFLDHAGRKCGILTKPDLKVGIGDRVYGQINYTTSIQWSLSNAVANTEIPAWAYYYSINITKCLTTRFFVQSRVKNITYATKDAAGLYLYNTTAYAATNNGIAIDITLLEGYGMGYVFDENDLANVYIASTVYTLSIISQDGNWVVCELKDVGTLGNTASPKTDALFEIYTPYKPSVSEPHFEIAQLYKVTNPTLNTREYSTLAGSIGGDITLIERSDGSNDYITENMSPADKFYKIWNTNAGRPNFIDTIGQQTKTNFIRWSNTYIQGTKTNGLSSFDALDETDIPNECGDIAKLQNSNKVGEDQGTIMLAICNYQVVSMYLGETQLVGAASNAFVAQSSGVIGTKNILKGSYGTTRPESVFEYNGLVFGIDLFKETFWQYSVSGLDSVSYSMTRFLKRYCKEYLAASSLNIDNINGFSHIRSMINPFTKEILLTLPGLIYSNYAATLPSYSSVPSYATSIIDRFDVYDRLAKTISFQYEQNKWGGDLELMPEWSEYLQGQSYVFKNGDIYKHDSDSNNYNKFFGVYYPIRLCVSLNEVSSADYELANIAIEGSDAPTFTVAYSSNPDIQITDLTDADYEKEGTTFFASFFGDRLSPNATGTADEKMKNGDMLTGQPILIMLEWDINYKLVYLDAVNLGIEISKGLRQIIQK